MPNLRDIRRRIRSVKSTQQVTRAMKIVAAAKLRRAQDRILATRPYAHQMRHVLASLAARTEPSHHPLLQVREVKKIELLVVSADKGLCGPFNANILRKTSQLIQENEQRQTTLQTVGKKARDYFKRRDVTITTSHVDFSRGVQYSHAAGIASNLAKRFIGGEVDAVYMIYNEFKSVVQQRVVAEKLLPIRDLETEGQTVHGDYIFEPSPEKLLDAMLPRHVEYQILRALLESTAAEFAARMTAMDSATRNAGDLILGLTRTMNRVRQAAITREIIEVVSGAEAL